MWHRLECPCNPQFRYKSHLTFAHHFESKRHELFEIRTRYKELRIQSGLLETSNTRLKHEKSILQSQYNRLNETLSQKCTILQSQYNRLNEILSKKCTESESLRAALDEMKTRKHLWAGRYIAHWITSRWRSYDKYRVQFNQCLKHLIHVHNYRQALRACYDLLEKT